MRKQPTKRRLIRALRNRLVHAAGCCITRCLGVLCYRGELEFSEWDRSEIGLLKKVRIPRSLRAIYKVI